jgi:hypothetical protein
LEFQCKFWEHGDVRKRRREEEEQQDVKICEELGNP